MSEFYIADAEKKSPKKPTKYKNQKTPKSEKRKAPADKEKSSTNAKDPSGYNLESEKLLSLSSYALKEAADHFIQLLVDNQYEKEDTPILCAALKVNERGTSLIRQLVQDEKSWDSQHLSSSSFSTVRVQLPEATSDKAILDSPVRRSKPPP